MATVGPTLPSLFGPSPEEVQHAIGRFASGDRFSALAREFFARLTQRSLDYYLSRELSNHIGASERFRDELRVPGLTKPLNNIAVRRRASSRHSLAAGTARTSIRRWLDPRWRWPLCPCRIQENAGRASEAKRCGRMSISCSVGASLRPMTSTRAYCSSVFTGHCRM
jgi:hypothetical protein